MVFRTSARSVTTLFSQGNRYSTDPARRRLAHLLAGNRQLRHVLSLQFAHKPLITLPIHGPAGVAYHIPAPEGQRLWVSAVPPSRAPKAPRKANTQDCDVLSAPLSKEAAAVTVTPLGPTVLKISFSATLRSVPPGKEGKKLCFPEGGTSQGGGGCGGKSFPGGTASPPCGKTRLLYMLRSLSASDNLFQVQC